MLARIAAALALGLLFGASPASAQERVTRLVVAFPAGGPVDLVARTIADQLGRELHERVIVENKAGGNGAIAAQYVAQSAPDGTTLWLTSVGAVAINPVLYDKLAYDVQRDVPGLIGFVRSGKLKAIGIAAQKRHPLLPDVPTLAEQGLPGVDSDNWYALFASAKTPPALIETINQAVRRTLAVPAVGDKLVASGAVAAYNMVSRFLVALRIGH